MSLKILLDDAIKELFIENPSLKSDEINEFEIAVANFANLSHLNGLDFDELYDGILGGGGDEGIDLCYLFSDGQPIANDDITISKDSVIRAKFFQIKKENGFSTDGFRKLKEGIEQIFDLDKSVDYLSSLGANADYIGKTILLRSIFRKAKLKRAKFACDIYYVTNADDIQISAKISEMEENLKNNNLGIEYEFKYWGAQQILDLRNQTNLTLEVKFSSQPIEVKERAASVSGYAGFMNGNDLIKTLTDKDNNLMSQYTEGNVRFFLGEHKRVNTSIIDTAKNSEKLQQFWAMNNGLTIIGENITTIGGSTYSIQSPQIVNGCQTVHCLYQAYKEQSYRLDDNLKVFVKLVETANLDIQTDIISATNSQNAVKSASLRANDVVQKNIEKLLHDNGIYYERRENFYKRQGYSGSKVIALMKMAQIINTVVNKQSIKSLNDVSSLFNDDHKYNSIFSNKADFELYLFSTKLYQKIWSLKNSDIRTVSYDRPEKRDLVSKGGFVFLNIMSSLLLSKAKFKDNGQQQTKILSQPFKIETPLRKNEFTKRKEWLLNSLNDESLIKTTFNDAKAIFFKAADSFVSDNPSKTEVSLFKARDFDQKYLQNEIDTFLKNEEILSNQSLF